MWRPLAAFSGLEINAEAFCCVLVVAQEGTTVGWGRGDCAQSAAQRSESLPGAGLRNRVPGSQRFKGRSKWVAVDGYP